MKNIRRTIIVLSSLSISLFAQGLHDWELKSYMNDITDIEYSNGKLWVASTGGAFSYNLSDSSISKFTNIDGLGSIDLTSIAVKNENTLVFGSATGLLNIYDIETQNWSVYEELSGQSITDILAIDDTLWVSSNLGVAVFVFQDMILEFRDFYNNFIMRPDQGFSLAYYDNKIFFATDKGLLYASANFTKYNLKIADAWSLLSSTDFLPSNVVHDLKVVRDTLLIGTTAGVSWYVNDAIKGQLSSWLFGYIDKIIYNGNDLYFTRNADYYKQNGTSWIYLGLNIARITCGIIDGSGNLWLGFKDNGLENKSNNKRVNVDGPGSNHVGIVIKDSKNNLWMTSGKFALTFNDGFYKYDFDRWSKYKFYNNIWVRKNSTVTVFEDSDKNLYFGSWGGGITVISDTGLTFYHGWSEPGSLTISTSDESQEFLFSSLPAQNSNCLEGAPVGVNDYTVITDFIEDPVGNIWMSSLSAGDNKYLAVIPRKTDGELNFDCQEWIYFGSNIGMGALEGEISDLEFDDFGRLWIATWRTGIRVFDYNGTLNNLNDDALFSLDIGDNLFSNTVLAIKKDYDGVFWIGTDAGLNSYDGQNVYRHLGEFGPIENKINHIFVDANNNKWFSTDGGLSILKSGKSPWESNAWVHYTTNNSGLPHDIVYSVFVDEKSGEAYIGTEAGLAIFHGSFAELKADFESMTGGPNPFILDGTSKFVIKNLMPNSTVKILSINGKLIRTLTQSNGLVEGSRGLWDGKDFENKSVASGIYLFLAYTEDGETGRGKIAVIKP